MMPAHETYDVIVIGAGAGGMTAAAVAAAEGLRVLVIEKTAFVGGTAAWSHGMVWIPANAKMKEVGLSDSVADAVHLAAVDHELQRLGKPWPVRADMQGDIFVRMLGGYFPQVGATVVRGDVARGLGLMDERLIGDSDWDWQLRLTRKHKTGFTPTPSVICRGRPGGSYDALQRRRVRYTRRIFWRHVRGNLRRWPTPAHLLRAYFGAMDVYYYYFVQAAFERAHSGDYAGARRAIRSALALNPPRALRSLFRRSRLGSATRRAATTACIPSSARTTTCGRCAPRRRSTASTSRSTSPSRRRPTTRGSRSIRSGSCSGRTAR